MTKKIFYFIVVCCVGFFVFGGLVRAEDEVYSIEEVINSINETVERIGFLQNLIGEDVDVDFGSFDFDGLEDLLDNGDVDDNEVISPDFSFSDQPLILRYNLRLGSRDARTGEEVSKLQSFLKDAGYYDRQIVGYFGPQTKKAVTAFQTDYKNDLGISRGTGYVGYSTRQLIAELTGADRRQVPKTSGSTPSNNSNLSYDFNFVQNNSSDNNNTDNQVVAPPPPVLLAFKSPTAGVVWELGWQQLISWSGPDVNYNVSISSVSQSLDGGRSYQIVNDLNTKSFNWRVGAVIGGSQLSAGQYVLKVCQSEKDACVSVRVNLVGSDVNLGYGIATDQFAYRLGERVGVKITIKNNSAVSKNFVIANCQLGFKVYAREASNQLVYNSIGANNCIGNETVSIGPNGSKSWDLSFIAQSLPPGIYDIKAVVNGNEKASEDFTIQ